MVIPLDQVCVPSLKSPLMICFCLFICFVIVLLLSANAGDANAPITTAATAKTVTNLELCGSYLFLHTLLCYNLMLKYVVKE
jgi:hypothetical protein